MRRIAAAVAVSLGICLLSPMQQADASERCVTRAEYRKVKDGMSPERVRRIFDSGGVKAWSIGRLMARDYVPCSDRQFGWVEISFKDRHLTSKRVHW